MFGDESDDDGDEEAEDDSDFDESRIPKSIKKHPGLNLKHKAHLKQVNKWRRKSKSGAEDYLAIIINAYVQSLGGNAIPAEAILSQALGDEYASNKLTNMNMLDLEDMKVGVMFIKAHCHLFRDTKGMKKVEQQLLTLFAETAVVVKTKVLIRELVAICSDPALKEQKAAETFKTKVQSLKQNEAHRIKMNSTITPTKICPSWNSFNWCSKGDDCSRKHVCLICKSSEHCMVNCPHVEEKTRWRMRRMNQMWKDNAPNRRSGYGKGYFRGRRRGFNNYGRGGFSGYGGYNRGTPHYNNDNLNNGNPVGNNNNNHKQRA